jgi:ABC-type sugar transport system permease subunit
MGNFKRLGNFEDQTGEKKEAILVGEAAYIRALQRRVFWPCTVKLCTWGFACGFFSVLLELFIAFALV